MLHKKWLAVLALVVFLPACSPGIVLVPAAGVAAATFAKERDPNVVLSDKVIEVKVNDALFRLNNENSFRLSARVNEGRVLLTGVVQDPDERVEAVRQTWQVEGVQEVVNEIQIDESGNLRRYAADRLISLNLRRMMLADELVRVSNYSVDTVRGVVYIMGIALSQEELDRVLHHARTMRGVERVVSYVRLKEEDVTWQQR